MTTHNTQAGSARHEVVRAGEADIDVLSQVIAEAFFPLAVCRWLIPDPAARRAAFPGYFRLYVEHAIADGLAHTTPDRAAAALWLPGHGPAAPPASYTGQLAAITGPYLGTFQAFDQALDRHHPAGVFHYHLAILAVRPDRQGQGIGTALLHAHHAVLDEKGVAAYLEASDERSRALYLRHGYTDQGPFHLPDGGPAMWPMWREGAQPPPDRPSSG
jgi:GNAT superfamily N-acetyltransferase